MLKYWRDLIYLIITFCLIFAIYWSKNGNLSLLIYIFSTFLFSILTFSLINTLSVNNFSERIRFIMYSLLIGVFLFLSLGKFENSENFYPVQSNYKSEKNLEKTCIGVQEENCETLQNYRIRLRKIEYVFESELSEKNSEFEVFNIKSVVYVDFRELNPKIIKGFFPDFVDSQFYKENGFRVELINFNNKIYPTLLNSKKNEDKISEVVGSVFKKVSLPINSNDTFIISNRVFYFLEKNTKEKIPQHLTVNFCWNGCPKISVIVKNLKKHSFIEASYSDVEKIFGENSEITSWEIPNSEKLRFNEISFTYLTGFALSLESALKSKILPINFSLNYFLEFNFISFLLTLFLYFFLSKSPVGVLFEKFWG